MEKKKDIFYPVPLKVEEFLKYNIKRIISNISNKSNIISYNQISFLLLFSCLQFVPVTNSIMGLLKNN